MRMPGIIPAIVVLAAGVALAAAPARAGGSPPALVGTPTVVPAAVDVSDGSKTVHVRAHLTDDMGVTGALFGFYHEDPEFLVLLSSATLDSGTTTNGTWSADLHVDQAANGVFRLWVEAYDADSQFDAETNVILTVTAKGQIIQPRRKCRHSAISDVRREARLSRSGRGTGPEVREYRDEDERMSRKTRNDAKSHSRRDREAALSSPTVTPGSINRLPGQCRGALTQGIAMTTP